MRVPGAHALLTAGVVAIVSFGTVTAFSLSGGSGQSPLPGAEPAPAAAPMLLDPPTPAPVPTGLPRSAADDDTRTAAPQPRDDDTARAPRTTSGGDAGSGDSGRARRSAPPRDRDEATPRRTRKKHDDDLPGNNTEDQVRYACAHGYLDGEFCSN